MNVGVMCCGCSRVMDADGKPAKATESGYYDFSKMAGFADRGLADAFAQEHGWKIADEKGANHRCPECIERELVPAVDPTPKRRGAYIEIPEGPQ